MSDNDIHRRLMALVKRREENANKVPGNIKARRLFSLRGK